MTTKKEFETWRKKIDDLDERLVDLLNTRTRYALEIGKLKAKAKVKIYDPNREEQVIRNVKAATQKGLLNESAIQRIFERIIDETRRTEREHRGRSQGRTAKVPIEE